MKTFNNMNDVRRFVQETEWKQTPKEFVEWKSKYPLMVLLVKEGNFYEAYCEDAEILARITNKPISYLKNESLRSCGFPQRELKHVLTLLVQEGCTAGVCE